MTDAEAELASSELESNHRADYLSEADQAMLDYAITLTITPNKVTEQMIERLRKLGFTDLAVHDLCCIVAYFAFVNRVADGLGVQLEAT